MRIFRRGAQSASATEQTSALERLRPWLASNRKPVLAGVALVVVLLSAAGFFILGYDREMAKQQDFKAQLGRLDAIAKASPQRLEDVRSEFDRIQGAIPQEEMKETDVFAKLLAMADSKGLEVRIQYQGDTRKLVGSTNYRIMLFNLNTDGSFDTVWAFLKELDGPPQELKTLVLDKITITVGEGTVASVGFAVYTRAAQK